jgi:hypothetical protein
MLDSDPVGVVGVDLTLDSSSPSGLFILSLISAIIKIAKKAKMIVPHTFTIHPGNFSTGDCGFDVKLVVPCRLPVWRFVPQWMQIMDARAMDLPQ